MIGQSCNIETTYQPILAVTDPDQSFFSFSLTTLSMLTTTVIRCLERCCWLSFHANLEGPSREAHPGFFATSGLHPCATKHANRGSSTKKNRYLAKNPAPFLFFLSNRHDQMFSVQSPIHLPLRGQHCSFLPILATRPLC